MACLAVFLQGYFKQRTPYLKVIQLWDKMGDDILPSRHDQLNIGRGETGMLNNDNKDSSISSMT